MSACSPYRKRSSSKPKQQTNAAPNRKSTQRQKGKGREDSAAFSEPEFLYETSFRDKVRRVLENGDVLISSGSRSIVLSAQEAQEALHEALLPPTHPSQLHKGHLSTNATSTQSSTTPVIIDARKSLPKSSLTNTPDSEDSLTPNLATPELQPPSLTSAVASPIVYPPTQSTRTTSFSCACCAMTFASVQVFRAHVRSPFHASNLRRQQQGLRALTEAEYERGKDDEEYLASLDAAAGDVTETDSQTKATKHPHSHSSKHAHTTESDTRTVSAATRRAARGAAADLLSSVLGVSVNSDSESGDETNDQNTSDTDTKHVRWTQGNDSSRQDAQPATFDDGSDTDSDGDEYWVSCSEEEEATPAGVNPAVDNDDNSEKPSGTTAADAADASEDDDVVLGDTTPFITISSVADPTLSVCLPKRLLLPPRMKIPATKATAKAMLQALTLLHARSRKWVCLLSAGGKFAAVVIHKGVITRQKTFHNYVVRAKQGGSQAAYDKQGRRAQSVGSQIRRQQAIRFRERSRQVLFDWRAEIVSADRLIVFAPGLDWENLRMDDKEREKWTSTGGVFVCRGNAVRVNDVEADEGRVVKIGGNFDVVPAVIGASESQSDDAAVAEENENGKQKKKEKGKKKEKKSKKNRRDDDSEEEVDVDDSNNNNTDDTATDSSSNGSEIWYKIPNPEGVCGARAWHPQINSCTIDSTHVYLLHPQDPRIVRPLAAVRSPTHDESVKVVTEMYKARSREDKKGDEKRSSAGSEDEEEQDEDEDEDEEKEDYVKDAEEDTTDEAVLFYRNLLRPVIITAMTTVMAQPLPPSAYPTSNDDTSRTSTLSNDFTDEAEYPVPLELENPYLTGCQVPDSEVLALADALLAADRETTQRTVPDATNEVAVDEDEDAEEDADVSSPKSSTIPGKATIIPATLPSALNSRVKRWCAENYRYFTPVCVVARAAALADAYRSVAADHAARESKDSGDANSNPESDTDIIGAISRIRVALLTAEVMHTQYYLRKHALVFPHDALGRHLIAYTARVRKVPRKILSCPVAALLYCSACHEDARVAMMMQQKHQRSQLSRESEDEDASASLSVSVLASLSPKVTAALMQAMNNPADTLTQPTLSPKPSFSLTPATLTPMLSMTADEAVKSSLFAVFLAILVNGIQENISSPVPGLSGRSTLHLACQESFPFPFIHALLLAGADPTLKDDHDCVPLQLLRGPKRSQEEFHEDWRVFALAHPQLADWDVAQVDLRDKSSARDAESARKRAIEAAKRATEADARREAEAVRRAQSERDRAAAAAKAAKEAKEAEEKRAKEAAEAAKRRELEMRWRASDASIRAAEVQQQSRMAAMNDSEKRALAYDLRNAAAKGQAPSCAACGLAIITVPFERLSFKYCSMLCLRKHRDQLGE